MEMLNDLWEVVVQSYGRNEAEFQILAFVLTTGLLFIIRISRAVWWVGSRILGFFTARATLQRIQSNLQRIRSDGRWSEPVLSASRELQQRQRSSIPILMVANHKGGVGKTTLASNLGVYFAARRGMNVLFIDLDWQGTMSATFKRLLKGQETPEHGFVRSVLRDPFPEDRVERLFEARGKLQSVRARARDVTVQDCLRSSAFYAADDKLADLEDWLMIKWASARRSLEEDEETGAGRRTRRRLGDDDIRFRLLRFLLTDRIQKEFDIVVLDAPPRDTTAGINGLCAATHLVVPTRADTFSTAGAFKFMERVAELHDRLAPNAAMLGFVATMIANNENEPPSEARVREELVERVQNEAVAKRGVNSLKPIAGYYPAGSRFDFTPSMFHSAVFRDFAGLSIAYLESNDVRSQIIDAVGDALWDRMETLKERHERESA